MRIPSLISFVGFVLLIAATYCPLLRPFHLFNMNLFDLNKPYGLVIILVAVVGIAGTVLNNIKLVRLMGWLSLALVALLFVAAFLKVNTSFSFIPFKSLAKFFARQIAFKWGWYVMFTGAILALAGSLGRQTKIQTKSQAVS